MMEFTIYPVLPASDIRRARAWYARVLGLKPVLAGGEPIAPGAPIEPDGELLYDTGTAKFNVYPSDHAGRNEATAARLVVRDFEVARAELLASGVVFEEYDLGEDFRTVDGVLVSRDGERTSWLKDSEGNILAIGSSD
jgi:catechol 2,3-dioxygenase-like lactoylglutathione lyase family enzyme